jgi:molybdopterin converting factor small subunit
MVRVRFFAGFREKLGRAEAGIDIESEIKLDGFIEKLKDEIPEIEEIIEKSNAIIAVDQKVGGRDTTVGPDSEVAIFPPVSGG